MANDSPGSSEPPTGLSTPSFGNRKRGRYAMARSFENLVALANYHEPLREARRMVWRDKGEPVSELNDLWECVEHAAKGGMRAGAMAFSIRASVNLVLAFIRMRSLTNKMRIRLIQHAIFGTDTFRFAAMLGSFVSIYKYLFNALPLLFPRPPHPNFLPRFRIEEDLPTGSVSPIDTPCEPQSTRAHRQAHLSLSAEARQILIRKKTSRWHSVVAGAVSGGLAVMWEKRGRRITIAQQMFVRGLQGSYNTFADRHNIHLPNGEILVFGLACAQILYAFLLSPDTLPRSYKSWLFQAGKMPPSIVRVHKRLVREGVFDLSDIQEIIDLKDTTPGNRTILLERLAAATASTPDFGPRYAPCAGVHANIDSCMDVPVSRFLTVFKWMLPIYGALHLVPTVLFKRKEFVRYPWKMLLRASWGTARSSSFLAVLVVIYYGFWCAKHNLHAALSAIPKSSLFRIPQRLVDVLISKGSYATGGLLCALSLLVEEKRRRGELAMYVLPKGLESAWVMARGKGWVFRTGEFGEVVLTAIGMGMVMCIYQNDPQHLSGLVRRILYQFIGPN